MPSSLYLPPFHATATPEWERFDGENSLEIRNSTQYGGSVGFARHIGKALSPELWNDLLFRLQVRFMRIHRPWTLEHGGIVFGRTAVVRLDENELVRDIELWL